MGSPDFTSNPAPAVGEQRWVIPLPGGLLPSGDPRLSAHPLDWPMQSIVGMERP
jgi:ecotin